MKLIRLFTIAVVSFLLFFSGTINAGQWQSGSSKTPSETKPQVISSDIQSSLVKMELKGYFLEEVNTPRGISYLVKSPGATELLAEGAPDLPKFALSLVIPDKGGMSVRIISSKFTDYPNINIAPSKGNLSRTVLPSDIPFRYGKPYAVDAFWPANITDLRTPYILRDYRGQTLLLQPFQYNAMTSTLRVYTEMTVEVYHEPSLPAPNELQRSSALTSVDANYASIYKNHFGNFPSVAYVPVEETGKMLVICPASWIPLVQPLVDWKIKRGIEVEVVDVLAAGGTAANIQTFIANKYNTNGLTYVLLVGDEPQLPTLYAQGGTSDPSYGYILGSDSYAEVMIGRFSAESDADVITQVQRVLAYEINPPANGSWYSQGVAVASNQGPGDDGEMDFEHAINMRNDLMNFNYTTVSELYDGTHPGTTDAPGDPNNTDLFTLFQSGISLMLYTGHGSSTSCSTTGLSNNDVQNMTNTGMLPFIWSVACVNGEFASPSGPCFAETFLRAQVNGQPTGAIATFMSSINQSWNPPMDGQDEMIDILTQTYATNKKYSFGGLSVNGCLHMNDNYGTAGFEMTDTWHCFGDPTLLVRTGIPQTMTVNHVPSMPVGLTTLNVNCSFDGGLVALTMNGQVIATGIVVAGVATMTFAAIGVPDTIFVTVTGFNQIPYTGQVLVIPASGPYVIYQNSTANDPTGNNNGLVDFQETIDVDLTLQNVGLADALAVSATLSCTDPYITIVNGTAQLGDILSNTSGTMANAFQYTVANNVPDQHIAQFLITSTDGNGGSWTSSFSQLIQAPALEGGILSIDDVTGGDGDGYLEAGETANITIRCLNNGHSDAPSSLAVISTFSSFLTITINSFSAGVIAQQNYVDATYSISMVNNVAIGTNYDITLDLSSGAYLANKTYAGVAGVILEDFETNNFNRFFWGMGGNSPWLTTTYLPFEGTYCATNGDINDSESSELLLNLTAMADDSVTFWYKLSSEQDYDYLRFSIDGVELGAWSGTSSWSYTGFPITAGSHLLRFTYDKDALVSSGLDCAWLDNIRFPYGTQVTGIEQFVATDGIAVWPNPATERINVSLKNTSNSTLVWKLSNIQGQQIIAGSATSVSINSPISIDVKGIATGMYILTVEGEGVLKNIKVQKQ